jgi:branched-chain amino acid transport system substrate-binding protein
MNRKVYRALTGGLVSVILILCLASCKPSDTDKDIILGVAWPFDSDQSLFEEGIDMAVEEINREGGIGGQKLVLLKLDDASEVTTGMAAAKRLTENSSVKAVIGHKSSYISIPASAIYEEAGLVMLSPSSTSPELTKDGGGTTFRMIPSDEVLAWKLAEYLVDTDITKIVLYYTEDSYGKGLADAFEDQASLYGITVIDRFYNYLGTEDLQRQERKWRAFGYDGFFVAASVADGSKFIYDIRQAGIEGIFVGGNALDNASFMEEAGVDKEHIVIGSVFDPEGNAVAESYIQEFTDRYGQAPDIYAALGYDSVRILGDALGNTSNYDRSEIASELIKLSKWTGVCGDHDISENGDDIGDLVVIKELRDGTFSRLER